MIISFKNKEEITLLSINDYSPLPKTSISCNINGFLPWLGIPPLNKRNNYQAENHTNHVLKLIASNPRDKSQLILRQPFTIQ